MAENTFASRLETLEEKVQSLESTVVKLLNEIKKLKGEDDTVNKPKSNPNSKVVELPVEEKKKVTKRKATAKE